jgi:hypothetical protein
MTLINNGANIISVNPSAHRFVIWVSFPVILASDQVLMLYLVASHRIRDVQAHVLLTNVEPPRTRPSPGERLPPAHDHERRSRSISSMKRSRSDSTSTPGRPDRRASLRLAGGRALDSGRWLNPTSSSRGAGRVCGTRSVLNGTVTR